MRARRAGTPPTQQYRGGGGPAALGTVVSCPTQRAARPGAQRRDTPKTAVPSSKCPVPRIAIRSSWALGTGHWALISQTSRAGVAGGLGPVHAQLALLVVGLEVGKVDQVHRE